MNRFQAMALLMAKVKAQSDLKPASPEYRMARKWVSELIDLLGPDEAVRRVADAGSPTLAHIERLCIRGRLESSLSSFSI